MLSNEFWHGFVLGVGLMLGVFLVVYLMSYVNSKAHFSPKQ